MTKFMKILLTLSFIGFLAGYTGILWGIGTPLGAVFFGLFLISKVLDKETVKFEKEHELCLELTQTNEAKRMGIATGSDCTSSAEPV